ncbi:hypothetical protein [Vibrio atypicus]|uniref:hypothetical protein n=1 Tax=Vibrio atypicus TaxID=558271 RepID=UPI003736F8E4
MNIKELRQHLSTLPTIANNRRISFKELVKQNQTNGFSDLEAKLFLLAKDWAIDPNLPAIAKKHSLKKTQVKELLSSPLVHAAMLHCRELYSQHSIVDAAWIQNQRVRGFHLAMGDGETYRIDRNGLQCEGQETNLTAARGFLNDLEKTNNLENGIDARPMINVVNNGGTVHMSNQEFFAQFSQGSENPLGSVDEGEFEEIYNE